VHWPVISADVLTDVGLVPWESACSHVSGSCDLVLGRITGKQDVAVPTGGAMRYTASRAQWKPERTQVHRESVKGRKALANSLEAAEAPPSAIA
jgi:hypothetical protein